MGVKVEKYLPRKYMYVCMRIFMCRVSPQFIGPIGFGSEANVTKFLPDGVSLLFAREGRPQINRASSINRVSTFCVRHSSIEPYA